MFVIYVCIHMPWLESKGNVQEEDFRKAQGKPNYYNILQTFGKTIVKHRQRVYEQKSNVALMMAMQITDSYYYNK